MAPKLPPNKFRCKHCRRIKARNPHLTGNGGPQEYCGDAPCQRARKADWARRKYATNDEYHGRELGRSGLNRTDAAQAPPPVTTTVSAVTLQSELETFRQILIGLISVSTHSHVVGEVQVTLARIRQRGQEICGLIPACFDS